MQAGSAVSVLRNSVSVFDSVVSSSLYSAKSSDHFFSLMIHLHGCVGSYDSGKMPFQPDPLLCFSVPKSVPWIHKDMKSMRRDMTENLIGMVNMIY